MLEKKGRVIFQRRSGKGIMLELGNWFYKCIALKQSDIIQICKVWDEFFYVLDHRRHVLKMDRKHVAGLRKGLGEVPSPLTCLFNTAMDFDCSRTCSEFWVGLYHVLGPSVLWAV